MKLTEKQKRFCDYYIENPNGVEAAIKAGYSKNTAKQIAAENLTKPYLLSYIKERNDKLASGRIADMQEVKELWTDILRGNLEGVEIKDILKASEYIAKTNAAFIEKIEAKNENVNNNIDFSHLSKEEIKELEE